MEDYYPGLEPGDQPDELQLASHNLGAISASGNYFMLVAPTEIKITKIKVVVDTAIALHADNYYTLQLANLTQIDDLLATADTMGKVAGIAADTVREIVPDQNLYLRPDDALELQLTKVASGSNLSGLLVEIEYVVTGRVATTTSTTTTTTTTSSSTTTTSSSTTTTSSSTTTS